MTEKLESLGGRGSDLGLYMGGGTFPCRASMVLGLEVLPRETRWRWRHRGASEVVTGQGGCWGSRRGPGEALGARPLRRP